MTCQLPLFPLNYEQNIPSNPAKWTRYRGTVVDLNVIVGGVAWITKGTEKEGKIPESRRSIN